MNINQDMGNRVFGPVPSRRLGKSLGINNIPPKFCTYSCVYCQVGRTSHLTPQRSLFYDTDELIRQVKQKIDQSKEAGETIDYLTIVPDGEPTLDLNLHKLINNLAQFKIKRALITNGSLIFLPEVAAELLDLEWISIKMDAADERVWQEVDRPHGKLNFRKIITGLQNFARQFKGMLTTETMLIKNLNDDPDHLRRLAQLIKTLNPHTAFLSIPTRPPAEENISAPSMERINTARIIFAQQLARVRVINMPEEGTFFIPFKGIADLLAILAVHPMEEQRLFHLLNQKQISRQTFDKLLHEQIIIKKRYEGKIFYLKNLTAPSTPQSV